MTPFVLVNPIGWRFEGFVSLATRYAREGAVSDFLDRQARGERDPGEGLPGIVVRTYPDLLRCPVPDLADDTYSLLGWLGLPSLSYVLRRAVEMPDGSLEIGLPPSAMDERDPVTGLCACGCGMVPGALFGRVGDP